jgi:hypothetical protein
MSEPKITVSLLLASLSKAEIEPAETRTLADGTQVIILVGKLPTFPHLGKPTWYPLVLRPAQESIDRREAQAILRHFWQFQVEFPTDAAVKHSKSVLKRK